MDPIGLSIIVVVGLISSAFFSGMEIGLISLNRFRLRHDVERKNPRAGIIQSFVDNSEKLLGTTLAGTNLSNVAVAVASSALAVALFGRGLYVDLGTTLVSSAVVLVLGELTPKLLYRHYSYRLCLSGAQVLAAAAWVLAPLVSMLGALMRILARFCGRSEEPTRTFFVTREELKHLTKEGEAGGALTAEERQMIHGVFDFPHKTVRDVMIPLTRAVTVAPALGLRGILELSQRTGYARLPVLEAGKVLGIVNVYEILFDNTAVDTQTARDLMQPPQFVLSTDRINRVLPVLKANRNPISVVIDPQGRALGIATIEDLVEQIVGDVEG